jgi:hypothetical protein
MYEFKTHELLPRATLHSDSEQEQSSEAFPKKKF